MQLESRYEYAFSRFSFIPNILCFIYLIIIRIKSSDGYLFILSQ